MSARTKNKKQTAASKSKTYAKRKLSGSKDNDQEGPCPKHMKMPPNNQNDESKMAEMTVDQFLNLTNIIPLVENFLKDNKKFQQGILNAEHYARLICKKYQNDPGYRKEDFLENLCIRDENCTPPKPMDTNASTSKMPSENSRVADKDIEESQGSDRNSLKVSENPSTEVVVNQNIELTTQMHTTSNFLKPAPRFVKERRLKRLQLAESEKSNVDSVVQTAEIHENTDSNCIRLEPSKKVEILSNIVLKSAPKSVKLKQLQRLQSQEGERANSDADGTIPATNEAVRNIPLSTEGLQIANEPVDNITTVILSDTAQLSRKSIAPGLKSLHPNLTADDCTKITRRILLRNERREDVSKTTNEPIALPVLVAESCTNVSQKPETPVVADTTIASQRARTVGKEAEPTNQSAVKLPQRNSSELRPSIPFNMLSLDDYIKYTNIYDIFRQLVVKNYPRLSCWPDGSQQDRYIKKQVKHYYETVILTTNKAPQNLKFDAYFIVNILPHKIIRNRIEESVCSTAVFSRPKDVEQPCEPALKEALVNCKQSNVATSIDVGVDIVENIILSSPIRNADVIADSHAVNRSQQIEVPLIADSTISPNTKDATSEAIVNSPLVNRSITETIPVSINSSAIENHPPIMEKVRVASPDPNTTVIEASSSDDLEKLENEIRMTITNNHLVDDSCMIVDQIVSGNGQLKPEESLENLARQIMKPNITTSETIDVPKTPTDEKNESCCNSSRLPDLSFINVQLVGHTQGMESQANDPLFGEITQANITSNQVEDQNSSLNTTTSQNELSGLQPSQSVDKGVDVVEMIISSQIPITSTQIQSKTSPQKPPEFVIDNELGYAEVEIKSEGLDYSDYKDYVEIIEVRPESPIVIEDEATQIEDLFHQIINMPTTQSETIPKTKTMRNSTISQRTNVTKTIKKPPLKGSENVTKRKKEMGSSVEKGTTPQKSKQSEKSQKATISEKVVTTAKEMGSSVEKGTTPQKSKQSEKSQKATISENVITASKEMGSSVEKGTTPPKSKQSEKSQKATISEKVVTAAKELGSSVEKSTTPQKSKQSEKPTISEVITAAKEMGSSVEKGTTSQKSKQSEKPQKATMSEKVITAAKEMGSSVEKGTTPQKSKQSEKPQKATISEKVITAAKEMGSSVEKGTTPQKSKQSEKPQKATISEKVIAAAKEIGSSVEKGTAPQKSKPSDKTQKATISEKAITAAKGTQGTQQAEGTTKTSNKTKKKPSMSTTTKQNKQSELITEEPKQVRHNFRPLELVVKPPGLAGANTQPEVTSNNQYEINNSSHFSLTLPETILNVENSGKLSASEILNKDCTFFQGSQINGTLLDVLKDASSKEHAVPSSSKVCTEMLNDQQHSQTLGNISSKEDDFEILLEITTESVPTIIADEEKPNEQKKRKGSPTLDELNPPPKRLHSLIINPTAPTLSSSSQISTIIDLFVKELILDTNITRSLRYLESEANPDMTTSELSFTAVLRARAPVSFNSITISGTDLSSLFDFSPQDCAAITELVKRYGRFHFKRYDPEPTDDSPYVFRLMHFLFKNIPGCTQKRIVIVDAIAGKAEIIKRPVGWRPTVDLAKAISPRILQQIALQKGKIQ